MMKKIALAAALTLAGGVALAQTANDLYIGGAFGSSEVSVDNCGGCDSSDTGYKIYGGYKLDKNFSVEVGYIDFGKATSPITDIKVTAPYIAAAGRLDFSKEFSGVARLGIANVDTDITILGSESNAKLYFGLGLEYAFTKNVKGTLAADFTQGEYKGDKGDVHLLSVGVQYDF